MYYKKTAQEDWFIKVDDEGKESSSFTNRGEIGKILYSEMQAWIASDNTLIDYVEPELTLAQAEQDSKERISVGLLTERMSGRCASGLGFDMDNRQDGLHNDQSNIQTAIDLELFDYLKDADDVTNFANPDDHTIRFTQAQFEAVLMLMKVDGASKMLKYHQKQIDIENASTIDEYNLITW